MPPYQYQPLNEREHEIRLVNILPGSRGSEMVVELQHCNLIPCGSNPQFEALSYTWGSPENGVEIKIGRIGHDALTVTQNLGVALQYLRYLDKPRTLWIDAICVNQKDLLERSQQVMRMPDLYTQADRVVVWLGPEGIDTQLALHTLEDLSFKVAVDWNFWTCKPAPGLEASEEHWTDPDCVLPYNDNVVMGIATLFKRPWYERLWVQQEIRLANDAAIVLCGHDTILFSRLRKAALCLFNKRTLPYISKEVLNHVWQMGNIGYRNVVGIMASTRFCKCFDPRDRVFAVLSFMEKEDRNLVIRPNYNETVEKVFEETTRKWIVHNTALDVLHLCSRSSTHTALPSWVPDLCHPPTAKPFQLVAKASSRTSCEASFVQGILSLQGVPVATLSEVHTWLVEEETTEIIQRLAPPGLMNESYIGQQCTLLDAFCSTLNGGILSRCYIPDDISSPNFETFRETLKEIVKPDFDGTLSEISMGHLDNVERYLKGRLFFRTKQGHMGLAPIATLPGDEVVILLGGRSAFVLRPTSHDKYQLVGECYIHDFMYGEALLGTLPPYYRSVSRFDIKRSSKE
ncbi:hypothetical protein HYFRA_00006756 [Hymenoscyphus fraxineus]|uniref:Heterokaryon incompatibility domain-containing protein n=1 Tax=Hymenoscyphus fraxineus TaxID=746836 RepID=A0A9N9KWF2_9HELO|nr:hypothetical protein HYFRA_00006756 [Hymenoscyphus fraxineus]